MESLTRSEKEPFYRILPLEIDPESAMVTLPANYTSTPSTSSVTLLPPWGAQLAYEIDQLNKIHQSLKTFMAESTRAPSTAPPFGAQGLPPPPQVVLPKRTSNIDKSRDSGNLLQKNKRYPEALRMYTLAIDLALARPMWEPAGLPRQELSILYANRAQTHIMMQQYAEGFIDAKCALEVRLGSVGITWVTSKMSIAAAELSGSTMAKAWFRGGKCLLEMGRIKEAREWLEQAIEMEGGMSAGAAVKELKDLLDLVNEKK